MKTLHQRLAAAVALTIVLAARAEYPDHPVHIVVPFGGGGAADSVARTIGSALEARFGQPFVIENRIGADGAIAGQAVASAPADGYTILYAVSATAALPFVSKTSYRATDFVPITTIGTYDFVMLVSAALPVTSVREFVSYAKAHPGKLNFATMNIGEHFAAAQFMRAAGIDMTHVPYRSMSQILPDMVAGQVHVNFGPLFNGLSFAGEGRMRILATLSTERSPRAPEVPTLREAGLGDVAFESVQMLFAPAGTNPATVEKLSREVNTVLSDPVVRARLEKLTLRVRGSTPDALRRAQAAAYDDWARFAVQYQLNAQ